MRFETIGIISAFLAGTATFFSPCVLPVVPGFLAYITGSSHADTKQNPSLQQRVFFLYRTFIFVLGFSSILFILGGLAGLAGDFLLRYQRSAEVIGGLLVLCFGLLLSDLLRLSPLMRSYSFDLQPENSAVGAYLLGLSFGFGWTPCVGPILGSILTLAGAGGGFWRGGALLLIYSTGLALPFLLVAFLFETVFSRITGQGKFGARLKKMAGYLLILLGLLMVSGYFGRFSQYAARLTQ